MASKSAILSTLILLMTTSVFCERWARQIPNNDFIGTSANDWIPVPCPTCKPNDRQQGGRVINFAQTAQASSQQHQFVQNVIPHQKHWQHPKIAFNEEPMRLVSQGFLVPPQPNQQQYGFVNQYPQFAYNQHENQQQYLQRVPIPQVNNLQYEYVQHPQIGQQTISQPLAEALIMQKPQVFDKNEIQMQINQLPQQQQQQPEEVQLLYVPLDTLYQQKQQHQGNEANRNNLIPPNINPHQINNFYTASPVSSSTPASSNSIPSYRPTESPSFYERTKVKSNQPPLAMFMKNKVKNSEISIGDVLGALKNAKNIDVLDSASKKSPKVFVGPSGLKTPEGYTKFELPYLSTIEQDRPNRQINNLPFFVAPLSYHAPNGFAKIPLPSPHVGSVVVNSPDNTVESAINSETGFSQRHPSFYQPTDFQTQQFYEQNFNFFNPTTASILTIPTTSTTTTTTTTPRPITAVPTARSTTQRQTTPRPIQRHTTRKPNLGFRFGSNVFPSSSETYQSSYEQTENPTQSFSNQYYQAPSSTTERNFEYYNRDQDIYNRPTISPSTQNPFDFFNKNNNFNSNVADISSTVDPMSENNNRGPPVDSSRTKEYEFPKYSNLDAYKTFKPIPTAHVTNEEYFNIGNKDSVGTFPSNQTPEKYNDNTSQAPFLSSNSPNEYTNFRGKYTFNENPNSSKEKTVEETYQSQTAKPIEYSTKAQEKLQMNAHFREQNSQYTRPNLPSSEPVTQRTFSYTPVTISYENLLKPLSSTANYDFFGNLKNSEDPSSDIKAPKISYFTPTPNYDEDRTEKSKEEEQVKYFKYSIIDQKNNVPESDPPNKGSEEVTVESVSISNPSIGNKYWESNNQYNGPSTLRTVQSLPGLINGLMDETSEKTLPSTTETVNIPRRSQTRRRRPDTTQSPSTSTTENSARRTTFRGRRPIHYANRTTTVRTTIARNTSRVRYNPTPEERQQLRGQNSKKKESENLDYQRDVLKQNYPVISKNPSTDAPIIEKLSSSYSFEPESQKTNFENEYVVGNAREDVITREDVTTVVPITTSRPVLPDTNQRTNFRQSARKTQRYGTTTTDSPSSGPTQTPERLSRDRYTVRPRSRYETTTQQARTTKKRADLRQRRPTTTRTPATSTISGKDDKSNSDSYQQISRFNTDFYQETTPSTPNHRGGNQQKNHRYTGSHFGLKSEETRWSVKSNQSSFQPFDPDSNYEEGTVLENEPMIVTAQSYSDQDLESFNIPVKQSFDFSPIPTIKGDTIENTESPSQGSAMETLFEDLVNELVTDSKKNEIIPEAENADNLAANHKTNFVESNVEKKGQRRGVWKRIRVRPLDGFETAESQNYGQQYINHIPSVDVKEEKIKQFNLGITSTMEIITSKAEIETTTPLVESESHTEISVVSENDIPSTSTTTDSESISTTEAATEAPIEITTTVVPEDQSNILSTIGPIETKIEDTTKQVYDQSDAQVTEHVTETPYYDDYETEHIFAESQNENREDDQEPQPSNIFSEVKQKLTDLFTIDNDYDYQENNLPLKMQQYTTIERNKSLNKIPDEEIDKKSVKPIEAVTEATSSFHKNLMDSVIYATSTSTEVSHETEICYRGRCIKTDKKLKT